MADSDADSRREEARATTLGRRIVGPVLDTIPATVAALVVGAFVGGFLGLAAGPLAPFGAIAGALLLGVPVAVWEHVLLKRGESARDYLG